MGYLKEYQVDYLLQILIKHLDVAATVEPLQEELSFSLLDMAAKGGWLMIVLAILSVIAIYIFGERWWAIRRAGKIDKNLMKDINDYNFDGKTKSAISL